MHKCIVLPLYKHKDQPLGKRLMPFSSAKTVGVSPFFKGSSLHVYNSQKKQLCEQEQAYKHTA